MARRVTVECCGCCGKPIIQRDDGKTTFLDRTEFVKIEVETIRGGVGWPKYGTSDCRYGAGIRLFREDVCGDCYDELQALLEPIRQLIHKGSGREEHHVSAVRDNVVAPAGRGAALLRVLPFFHHR